ncbi:MAG TPA: hypothetical protein VGM37_18860 [Armatimonadota bacterium]|jgi:hypothetical protein
MRKILAVCLCIVLAAPGWAQYRRLKLDSLGLPPFPGATNVGHIGLPLASILKPEPGQKMTGPALTDLAINTYRTPLSVSVDRIARFYLKYAGDQKWRLLDDLPDSASTRTLVFWSKEAPGYLTVEILAGPNNTRQIDLTRLLGDVNPSRPGEVLRLTGKRVREQRVEVTFAGRFLDLKTNKPAQMTIRAIEDRSETGLTPDAARYLAPMGETYALAIRVTDSTKGMTGVDVYSANGDKVAHAESARPVGTLTVLGKVRATEGPTLRAVIMGYLQPPPTTPAAPAAAKPARPAYATPKAKTKQGPKPAVIAHPAAATPALPPPAALAAPAPAPTVLTEWYGLRPSLTAMPELRRAATTTKSDSTVIAQDVEMGPSCDGPLSRSVEYATQTTERFGFSPDLFGGYLSRAAVGSRTGTLRVDFPQRSGSSNTYTLTQAKTTTTADVNIGYSFQGQWVTLPGKKPNPVKDVYTTVIIAVPQVTKRSSGSCAPAAAAVREPALATPTPPKPPTQ